MKHPKRGGLKFDAGKPRMDLLSPYALQELSKVLSMGAVKYGDYNWQEGIKYSRILAAILRHTMAYMSGESTDPESGLSHIAHVMCNCMFLLHFEKYGLKELDDRPKYGKAAGKIRVRTPKKRHKKSKKHNQKSKKTISKSE